MVQILIIEDEALTAMYLSSLLEDMGCDHVAVAYSEAEAYRLADRLEPQLLVADVNLGRGGNGLKAAKRIAEEHGSAVIFVTGNSKQIEQDLFDGVIALIEKPLSPATLRAAVETTL